jgi:hypothetical protein
MSKFVQTQMLPWYRDRFDDIASDAETLLANPDCAESMKPGLLGIKAVAEQMRESIVAHLYESATPASDFSSEASHSVSGEASGAHGAADPDVGLIKK